MTETSTLEQARQRASLSRGELQWLVSNYLSSKLVNGLLFGGQLALMAVGLTLITGRRPGVKLRSRAMFMVGGFVGYFILGATGNIVVAVVSAAPRRLRSWIPDHGRTHQTLRDREEFGIPSMVVTLGLCVLP